MSLLRRHFSPALFISLLALFVALGGAGMAATGDSFILGAPDNNATATTWLTSNVSGPSLFAKNPNAAGVGVRGLHAGASGAAPGLQGDTSSTAAGASGLSGSALSGSAASDSNGVKGVNAGAGRGVYGQSASGYGVYGTGKFGLVGGGSDSGVWATTSNYLGSGVYGQNTAAYGPGYGVYGKSSNGYGVYGNGALAGVLGKSDRTATAGVRGENTTPGGWGVFGRVTGNSTLLSMGLLGSVTGLGEGVHGEAETGRGVYGAVTGKGEGVFGWASGQDSVGVKGVGTRSALAGQFDGDVEINGYLRLAFRPYAPPSSDCLYNFHRGRAVVVTDAGYSELYLYVCGPGGWFYRQLVGPVS